MKFKNKYTVESARLQNYDYGKNCSYFITICTKDKYHYFGKVVNGFMEFNEKGKIVHDNWIEIPKMFPYAELDVFVIMPDHMHGIIKINKPFNDDYVETRLIASLHNRESIASLQRGGWAGEKNPMLNDNISRIIRWYKGRCTNDCRKLDICFCWGPRFYDRVIRKSDSLFYFQQYIIKNPLKWFEKYGNL